MFVVVVKLFSDLRTLAANPKVNIVSEFVALGARLVSLKKPETTVQTVQCSMCV